MAAPKTKRLDVRPLLERGLQPCDAVDAALADLRPGERLTVLAPFLPSPLIERCKAAGYTAHATRAATGWQVDFWRD